MKLALFGGTGKTGRLILDRALSEDNQVTVLTRDPSKLPPGSWRLTIQLGDVRNADVVDDAIFGADAVVCALGQTASSAPDTLSAGVANIIMAMRDHDLTRIVVIAGAGLLDAVQGGLRMEQPDFPAELLTFAAEHRRMWEQLRDSGLRWTLICPTYMTTGEAAGAVRVSVDQLPADAKPVAFADVAAFTYDQLASALYIGKRVGICS